MQNSKEFKDIRDGLVGRLIELDKYVMDAISAHLQTMFENLNSIVLFLRKVSQPPLTIGLPDKHVKELESQRSHIKKIREDILELKDGRKKRFMTRHLMKIIDILKDANQTAFRKILLKSEKRELFLLEWFEGNIGEDYMKYKESADSIIKCIAKLDVKNEGFVKEFEEIKERNKEVINSFGIVVETAAHVKSVIEAGFESALERIGKN